MLDYSAAAMLNALGTGETGTGITIGILSDSFDLRSQAAAEMAAGDLPAVKVLSEGPDGQDEGREMALLIHAIAPGATILFAAAFPPDGMVGMGRNIDALVSAGCNILVDDIFNTSEPPTGSPIELAIERCVAAGVSYFSAIGNFSQFGTVAHALTPGANAVGAIRVGATSAESYSSPGAAFLGPDGTTAPDFGIALGTSFAVANDAAASALVLQAAPKLTPAQLTAILKQSCSMIAGDPKIVGAGLPDIKKAVALAQATLDPTPVPVPAPKPVPVVVPAPVTIPAPVPVAPPLPRQPEGGISVIQPGAPRIDYGVGSFDYSGAHIPSWRAAHIFCEINGVMW